MKMRDGAKWSYDMEGHRDEDVRRGGGGIKLIILS